MSLGPFPCMQCKRKVRWERRSMRLTLVDVSTSTPHKCPGNRREKEIR